VSAKTRHLLAEDVEFMLTSDHPLRIAERVGRTPSTIARALYREGRPDLAQPFDEIEYERRKASGYVRPSRRAAA
jgi:hypothetical protein